jgi:hypothetical protein
VATCGDTLVTVSSTVLLLPGSSGCFCTVCPAGLHFCWDECGARHLPISSLPESSQHPVFSASRSHSPASVVPNYKRHRALGHFFTASIHWVSPAVPINLRTRLTVNCWGHRRGPPTFHFLGLCFPFVKFLGLQKKCTTTKQ